MLLYFSANSCKFVLQSYFRFLLHLYIFVHDIKLNVLLDHLSGKIFPSLTFKLLFIFSSFHTLVYLHFLHSDLVVQQANDIGNILIPGSQFMHLLIFLSEYSLQLENFHFHRYNLVILISNNSLYCRSIDERLFIGTEAGILRQIPSLDLPLHSPVFLLHIPDMGLQRAILLLSLIDNALKIVIFIPDDILGGHVAVEINIGMEDVVVGVYLFPQKLFVSDSFVHRSLFGLERFVVATQDK